MPPFRKQHARGRCSPLRHVPPLVTSLGALSALGDVPTPLAPRLPPLEALALGSSCLGCWPRCSVVGPSQALLGSRFCGSLPPQEAFRNPPAHHGSSLESPFQFSSVQSLSRVRLFVTPGIAACQASLSITNSRSLLKLRPIELVMPSSRAPLLHSLFQAVWRRRSEVYPEAVTAWATARPCPSPAVCLWAGESLSVWKKLLIGISKLN